MSTKKKKVLSLFLALVMVFSLLPGAVFATDKSETSTDPYRIVHLDCGRKYFSVENIKKLIDTMAQYGYNQLQLAFGNGGCRFLLDDMSLSFKDSSNETVEMTSDMVKANISSGNRAFNGDARYLSQTDMDGIIAYANEKGIDIVPMLNMPGHATAIVYGTSYASKGNLDVTNEVARNYGYALLGKYVEYFNGKGCKFFHFGSDESGYTGPNMTTFLTGCAKVITDAGMTPRAFNDATNVATMPKSVQITYWHQENGSQTASALDNADYQMINTHGRWYYVIKTAKNSEIGTKYWQGTVNSTATSVELPVLKATNMDKKWVGINEYFDGNPGYGSTIPGSLGTMFCIWCDASQDAYLTDSDVISENENYGALYQLEKLAEQYWPDDIKTKQPPVITLAGGEAVPATMTNGSSIVLTADKSVTWETSDDAVIALTANESLTRSGGISAQSVTAQAKGTGQATITATDDSRNETSYTITVQDASAGTTRDVTLTVGESTTFDVGTADVKDYITGDAAYIATATVAQGQAQAAGVSRVSSIESGKTYLITNYRDDILLTNHIGTYNNYNALTLNGTPNTASVEKWTITSVDGGYTIQDRSHNHNYLTIGYLTASVETTKATLALTYDTAEACWTIAQDVTTTYYLNQLGGADARVAGGYTDGVADVGSRWYIYEVTEETPATNTLTITGTGEGTTTVTVGDVTYNITVTARTSDLSKALSYEESFTLPSAPNGGSADYAITSGASYVTLNGNTVTAGTTKGDAVVTATIKNAGGYVTDKYTYKVKVTEIDLTTVDPLPVQLWITNTWVGADAAPTSLQTVNIKAADAYSESGVLLGNQVPSSGYKKDGSSSVRVTYWKGVVLHDGKVPVQQGTDYSSNGGDDFLRVRYWNSNWQYLYGSEWTNIDLSSNKDTVIAYYLQINNVAPEITTGAQHYGNPPTSNPGTSSANGYNLTAFAVVYPDGTLSRTEQQMFETGMVRGYWRGTTCNLGAVYAENNSTYRISKITLTWGSNVKGDNSASSWYTGSLSGTYGTDWGVAWDKKTNSAGDEWYDETIYWKHGDSDIPMINGEKDGLNFTTPFTDSPSNSTGKNAALILIYLEVVETENTLNVIY